jgi:hypothetical protein
LRRNHSQRDLRCTGIDVLVPGVGRDAAIARGERQHQVTAVLLAPAADVRHPERGTLREPGALVRQERRVRRDDHDDGSRTTFVARRDTW